MLRSGKRIWCTLALKSGTNFSELAKRIIEYTGQLLVGPKHCGPSNQNFGWATAHPISSLHRPHGAGERCKALPVESGTEFRPQSHCAVLYARKTRLACSIFGSLVSIAISGKMKSNPGSSRIWYLRHHNYKHYSRSNWQVNFRRVQNCGPPKFCGPVRPNTSIMPKAGPDSGSLS